RKITAFEKYKTTLIVVLVFLFFAFGFNIFRVQGDGLLYYAFLEKMLGVLHPESSDTRLDNVFFQQAGCAYFNAPFYLCAYAIERIFHFSPNFNGITLRQIAINLSSNFYLVLSLILAVKILHLLNFKHKILPVLSILFSTSAFTVAVIQPSWSHTVDIFITTSLVYTFLINRHEKNPQKTSWLGIILTIAILVRYFNFLLFCIFYLRKNTKKCPFLR
ncbi:hypothetical protein ACFL2Y_02520, partial [Candidatus Omnitrophota bacterium]